MKHRIRLLTDEHGVALPMAMLALLILSALVVGFVVLSSSEPTIATNQLKVAQARSLAEAGVERAIWALKNPTIGIPATGAIPAPYNGTQFVPVSTGGYGVGGFRVTVAAATTVPYPPECPAAASMSRADRCIVAVGWVPDENARNAHQKISVVVSNPQLLFTDPPAALSVRGDIQTGGNMAIDSRSDDSCGQKVGSVSTGSTTRSVGSSDNVWGAGDDVPNQKTNANDGPIPSGAKDIVWKLAKSEFDKIALSDADINALRAYAKAHNGNGATYLQGPVAFSASNQMANGLVFVDTLSGKNITQEGVTPATDPADFASVDINGNAAADPSGIFKGWIFANGMLSIDGAFAMHGLAYAQNDISYHGVGTGGVFGAMISRNILDTASTSIDSDLNGNASITYNCAYAKTGDNTIPNTWTITPKTYRELCDSLPCT